VPQCLGNAGLIKGKTIGLDATTLEANAALRTIVWRDTGEGYEEFLTRLALLVPSLESVRSLIEKHLRQAGVSVASTMVLNRFDTIVGMVEAGQGTAIVPSYAQPVCQHRRVVMSRLNESDRPNRVLSDSESREETAASRRGVRDVLAGVHCPMGGARRPALTKALAFRAYSSHRVRSGRGGR
jgi:LysR substrate binding domain-containing protein